MALGRAFLQDRGSDQTIGKGKKLLVNGARQAGKALHVGDRIRLRLGPYEHQLTVRGFIGTARAAPEAVRLYEEDATPKRLAGTRRAAGCFRPVFRRKAGPPNSGAASSGGRN
jgi:ribosomal 50S subunit-recycling heat shock protein